MELYPGVMLIHARFEETRYINLTLLRGEKTLLVDSGVAGVPTETVLPYLKGIGMGAGDLDYLVNLHAHADHLGGDGELLEASGAGLTVCAHAPDADLIADHQRLAREGYRLTDPDKIATLLRRCGQDVPVARRLKNGDVIDLGGKRVEVIHVPGHTPGNISLFEQVSHGLIHGESILGPSEVNDQGRKTSPFGRDPLAYRMGLERLLQLEFRYMVHSHRPPVDRNAGAEWLASSIESTDTFLSLCRSCVASAEYTGAQLVSVVAELGGYQIGPRLEEQVQSIVGQWMEQGQVRISNEGRYVLSE